MGIFLLSLDDSFQKVFSQLWHAESDNKTSLQESVFEEAGKILKTNDGLEKLFRIAHLFDDAGLFVGRPWQDVSKLNPTLVKGTLQAGGTMEVAEILSELRILAISKETYIHPEMSPSQATEFLNKVIALNLDLLIMKETEENRVNQVFNNKEASNILRFISRYCFSPLVFHSLYEEINNLALQRPIVTDKILELIDNAKKLSNHSNEKDLNLMRYESAIYSPTELSSISKEDYLNKLKQTEIEFLVKEAMELRSTMNDTGLVSDYHVLFLKHINGEKKYLLEYLLSNDNISRENLNSNMNLISNLISFSINKYTKRSIYGLMKLLQRNIFTNEFKQELEKLIKIPINSKIEEEILNIHETSDLEIVRPLIISGIISILGQPLGVGQGFNPTCQSTRLISYLSQKDPVGFLKICNHFLENNKIIIDFEGTIISSEDTSQTSIEDKINIDTVSIILLPHLNSIYLEMLRLTSDRGQDPHRWVNPAFNMHGVWPQFSDIYNDEKFKERFYKYYSPVENPNINEELPQPAGITIYSQNGQILGSHAVLIQRVDFDPSGLLRIYFYNPNNDSLQTWANSIKTSISGNGEKEGESSLLFEDFLYFLYAYHYPNEIN